MAFVGKKWGIELYPVAGCIVTEKLLDSVETVHTKLWIKMDSIHGLDSEKKFRKEIIAEMKRISELQEMFDSNRQIKKRIRKLKGQTSINLESVSADGNIYYWIVYSYERNYSPEFKWEPEFKVGIDFAENGIEIIELK